VNGTNYEVHSCGVLSNPHSHSSGTSIRLTIMFSNTLSLHSSFNVGDNNIAQLAILVLFILIFGFLRKILENKSACIE
jgi:hypothetical protein